MSGGFKPGHKKLGGRPRGGLNKSTAEIKAVALELCPEMLERLAELARTAESEAVRVDAAVLVLNYGIGKPKTMTELSGPDGGPVPVSFESMQAELANLLQSIKERHK